MDKVIDIWMKSLGKYLVILVMLMMLFMVGAIEGMQRAEYNTSPDIVLSYKTSP